MEHSTHGDTKTLLEKQKGVAQFVEALRNNSEGLGFDFRFCHWDFSLT